MVDVGLRNHRCHGLLYCSLTKLVQTVLVPYGLEIEVRSVQEGLEECYTPCVRDSRITLGVLRVSRQHPISIAGRIFVMESPYDAGRTC